MKTAGVSKFSWPKYMQKCKTAKFGTEPSRVGSRYRWTPDKIVIIG